ncbi:hypothetical protein ADM98_08455 [Exiguobacterium sp. BMC-KP]|uniref:hypothetical protein n=1 Tax=Exiguobacterium sp. BMC-KP TaxID=1684312 RepID=UPI0006AA2A51|nr:hypothetical protein [Exiguobacterium sp. BMC-KP]KOP28945.1 hypothetical protein ADM98_08455 [Exiguobacterium sp. BMC-KP]
MAKRPLTPRECELVVCSLYVMELIPFEGIMERLESITLRDIIGPVARGESTREQAADALDQYIKVRRRRFRNVPPEHLWSLDDRIEQEALRMIRKRSPLSAGEKLQPKAIPHEMGDTVEMKVTEIQDRNNKVTLIGKVGNVTAKLPVANRQAYKGNKTIPAWITGVEKKPALLHLSTSDYGKHQPSEDIKAAYATAVEALRNYFETNELPTTEEVDLAKSLFQRMIRRDQNDWFTVYVAMGRPQLDHVRRWVKVIQMLARSLRGDEEATQQLASQEDRFFKDALLRACKAAEKNFTS